MEKNWFTFPKVTALLCALAMLFGIFAFFGSDLMAEVDGLNEQIDRRNENIATHEEAIARLQSEIENYQQEIAANEAQLPAAQDAQSKASKTVEDASKKLDKAEDELDEVCYRSYYSSWYCTTECRPLHTAVENREAELDVAQSALTQCANTIRTIQSNITQFENQISRAEENKEYIRGMIKTLEAENEELRDELTGAWFEVILNVLAMLLALGGLSLLVKNFYTGAQDQFTLYAVAGLAGSALLFLIEGAIDNVLFENAMLLYLLTSPHFWNLGAMGLLAAVLLEKTEKPVVLRNIAVALSVIAGLAAILNGAFFIGPLYAAAMICTAFVLVPLVFTEHIDVAKHIFLSAITFGVWTLVWIYHVTKNLNKVEAAESRKPARELLLCIFLPFYYPFWLYKTAEGVEDYGEENGKAFKIDILCIAFAFVCPLFATVLIQNKINVVVGKPVCTDPAAVEACE